MSQLNQDEYQAPLTWENFALNPITVLRAGSE